MCTLKRDVPSSFNVSEGKTNEQSVENYSENSQN